jgi:hypothetical protein
MRPTPRWIASAATDWRPSRGGTIEGNAVMGRNLP